MKDTLIEIKNNLQGNESRVDEAKNQINDLENKEAKKQPIRTRRKKNPKKPGQCKQPLGQLQDVQHHIIGVPGEEKEQEIGKLFEKTVKENFPNLVKEIDMQIQEAQSPKQDGYKEAHIKKHHN